LYLKLCTMKRKTIMNVFFVLTTFICITPVYTQCDTTYLSSNLEIEFDEFLSGVYYIEGDFILPVGMTVYVLPYSSGSCGKLEINASNIIINGTINGNYAGYPGGNLGTGGNAVNSITGDQNALTNCSNKDNAGRIEVAGGMAGISGEGIGGGNAGLNGGSGSGPKQKCESSSDTYGMIPGAGGGGAGGGGSYGGSGTSGNSGGSGSLQHNASGTSVSSQYPILAGIGGLGGVYGNTYGTENEDDIALGSGGGGSGGGGRSYETGLNGLRGGNGGGLIILNADDDLQIEGVISVNGEDGKLGGHAGSGGESSKCCDDACNDCGEATLSSGAGGGGGSGAGSGGGILLKGHTASISGTLSANGGVGGNGGNAGSGISCSYSGGIFCGTQNITTNNGEIGGKGGDGGGGRIKIFVELCHSSQINPSVTVNGGVNAQEGSFAEICSSYVGLSDNDQLQFSVYPNPTDNQITLTIFGATDEDFDIQISDIKGTIVYSTKFTGTSHSTDLSFLSSGIYVAVLNSAHHLTTVKIIKR